MGINRLLTVINR